MLRSWLFWVISMFRLRGWLVGVVARLSAWILRNLLLQAHDDASECNISEAEIDNVLNKLHFLTVQAQDTQRRLAAQHSRVPSEIWNFDRTARLDVSVMSQSAPWLNTSPEEVKTPAMITPEEEQYYTYIGSFFEGVGRAVELGPWLGASTQHIVGSLAKNPRFAGERLHVIDDFIWRKSWMDEHVPPERRLPEHACFRHLFGQHTERVQHLLKVQRAKITDYEGNEKLPVFSWSEGPIEFLYVDCGRTIEANQAWYSRLQHAFIPGRTLIMMQDWRTHRELPRKWFNQMLLFTEEKGAALTLLHEVTTGGLASFIFTGWNGRPH
jgi:hypothetical protein